MASKHIRKASRSFVAALTALSMSLPLFVPVPAAASGRVIFVSKTGVDGSVGTLSAPVRTIQAAVDMAGAGDTVYVRGGTYDERLELSRNGTAASPVTISAYDGETVTVPQGVRVSGSYQRIKGIVVTQGSASGPQVEVSGTSNVLDGISVHDTAAGTSISLGGSYNTLTNIDAYNTGTALITGHHNTISGGTLHHTSSMFMVIDQASYITVENLDMHDPGQSAESLADGQGSDGIDFNAHHLTLRNNRIYNVFMNSSQQHADAIQWWNKGDDLVLEGNVIGSRAYGGKLGLQDQGHIEFESGNAGQTSQRVIIRNNVFLGTDGSYVINGAPSSTILGQADNWQIIGNLFYAPEEIRGDFFANMRYLTLKDNVFMARNNFSWGAGYSADYNAYIGVSPSSGEGSHSFTVSNPMFANADVSAATGYGINADFHPLAGSPLLGKGVALASLPTDKGGALRPNPPSLGAYELAGTSPAPTPDPTPTPTPTPGKDFIRHAGPTRYDTAIATAKETYPGWTGVKDVVIASGADRSLVDALAGAGLAGAYKAPILLVGPDFVPGTVSAEVRSMPAGVRLHVVGGPSAVSEGVRSALAALPNVASADRISGPDRYATSAAVAREMKRLLGSSMPSTVLIANGGDASHFYDALALSPLAYKMSFPILLVARDSVPAGTRSVLEELAPARRIVGGGEPAVSEAVRTAVGARTEDRLSGATRFGTAKAIADYASTMGWLDSKNVAVAATVPDALTGGPMIAAKNGPMLLAGSTWLPAETADFLAARKSSLTGTFVCGGTSVVSDGVRSALITAVN